MGYEIMRRFLHRLICQIFVFKRNDLGFLAFPFAHSGLKFYDRSLRIDDRILFCRRAMATRC